MTNFESLFIEMLMFTSRHLHWERLTNNTNDCWKSRKRTSNYLFVQNFSKKSWIFFVRTSLKNVEQILQMKKYWSWSIYIRIEDSKSLFVITMSSTSSWTLTTTRRTIHLFKIFCCKFRISKRCSQKIVFENHKIEANSKQQKNEIAQKNDSESLTTSHVESFRDSNILKSLILFQMYKFLLINLFLVNLLRLCNFHQFNLFDRLLFISSLRCMSHSSFRTFSNRLNLIFRFRFNLFQIKCTINDSIKCTVNSFRFKTTQQQRKQSELQTTKNSKNVKKTQSELKSKEREVFKILMISRFRDLETILISRSYINEKISNLNDLSSL